MEPGLDDQRFEEQPPRLTFVFGGERLYLEGLRSLLAAHPRFAICDEPGDLARAGALLAACETAPLVLLVGMTAGEAATVVRRLRSERADLRIVSLGVVEHPEHVVAWAEAGVDGYVPREASLEQLIRTLEAVSRGESLCSPAMTAALMRRLATLARERSASGRPDAALTRRERQVAELLDAGLSNKQIAQRLQIELPTVKNHVHNVLEKLGVARRQEAAALLRGRR